MNDNHSIYFKTRDELNRVCLDDVMYASSDGNYVTLNPTFTFLSCFSC